MARIPDEEIARIKLETDLVALVRSRGVELGKHGTKDWSGRCPFHTEDQASFIFDQSGAVADGDNLNSLWGEAVDDPISEAKSLPRILVAVLGYETAGAGVGRDRPDDLQNSAGEDGGVARRVLGDVLDDGFQRACTVASAAAPAGRRAPRLPRGS